MHEMGIVTHVAKTLIETAEEMGIVKYGSVTLEVGEVSGIVSDLFIDCWNYFRKKNPLLQNCEMKIEITPAITICEDCQKTYSTVKYGRKCPYCQSDNTFLLHGNTCVIKEVEAETKES